MIGKILTKAICFVFDVLFAIVQVILGILLFIAVMIIAYLANGILHLNLM